MLQCLFCITICRLNSKRLTFDSKTIHRKCIVLIFCLKEFRYNKQRDHHNKKIEERSSFQSQTNNTPNVLSLALFFFFRFANDNISLQTVSVLVPSQSCHWLRLFQSLYGISSEICADTNLVNFVERFETVTRFLAKRSFDFQFWYDTVRCLRQSEKKNSALNKESSDAFSSFCFRHKTLFHRYRRKKNAIAT